MTLCYFNQPATNSKAYLYTSIAQIPRGYWRWKNFTPKEIMCKGSGEILINEDAMDKLQTLRNLIDDKLIINSAYRSELHNSKVGGECNSFHRYGRAFDISIKDLPRQRVLGLARKAGFTGFGLYPTFLHVDTGFTRTWGEWL